MIVKTSRFSIPCFIFLAALFTLSGCKYLNTQPPPQVAPCQEDRQNARLKELEKTQQQLRSQLRGLQDETEALRVQIRKSQIELLEKAALIKQLNARASYQQQIIDEAVVEVVRAKAKLRSIESRAEAASTMAETEIALKALKAQHLSDTDGGTGLFDKAEYLMRMSTEEFKRENYGGALYLAGQARSQIKAIQSSRDPMAGEEILPGEKIFTPPLPLILLKRSNLRKAPDIHSKVLQVLEKDLPIIGYSHKDDWIRTRLEGGRSGWVHQSLIQGR